MECEKTVSEHSEGVSCSLGNKYFDWIIHLLLLHAYYPSKEREKNK